VSWTVEHSAEAVASPEAIWTAWTDVPGWSAWNPDVERASLVGAFAPGGRIEMTLADGTTVPLAIADARPGESFVDEANIAGTVIRTLHRIERLADGRVRVVYRLEAEGAEAGQLGPAISADFPQTIVALLDHVGASGHR
jgi:hypothetical protein